MSTTPSPIGQKIPSAIACQNVRRLGVDAGQDVGPDVLEVHVGKPIGVTLDHAHRIHAGIRQVAGVEAQVEIGLGHQPLDLVLELDVAADVWMDDRVHAVLSGDVGDHVELLEHRRPPSVVEPRRRPGRPAVATRTASGLSISDRSVPPEATITRHTRSAMPTSRSRAIGIVEFVEDERARRQQVVVGEQ